MQFQFAALAVAALAAATGGSGSLSNWQCNAGTILCCQSVGTAYTPSIAPILGLLGIDASDAIPLIGVSCSPISVIGISGNSCFAQPVCCDDNYFNGVIAMGCLPIDLNL
ncbi:hypothetical protein D9619_012775 [Psilocybe cf. subviscida]|uniref:Hydrophobin n=1 Tax=Psilocybe cf. subviscida TaxID=2480587 RepID=A0A8H5ARE8_9AGAR|nr:hypothetical protein D9619_012775 [Psilocybe cf. subviscida]